jgi:hypothetical protein
VVGSGSYSSDRSHRPVIHAMSLSSASASHGIEPSHSSAFQRPHA